MDHPFESPVVLSFCPGILGIERGLARAGVNCRVAAYVEIEAFIIANLVAGMEAGVLDPAPIWTDAKTFDAQPFRGKVHGIIGGYPCPGESTAGLREGHLYKGFIWPSIRRAIAAARPLWCFFENVDDHLTGTYPIVQRSLRNMGYAVEAGIFAAKEAGASQDRERLFILAILANSNYIKRRLPKYKPQQEWSCAIKDTEVIGSCKEMGGGTTKLADSSSQRSQGMQSRSLLREGTRIPRPITKCRPQDFPLGQGFEQWEWEEPREIESRMEYSINGYQFEGDLLRAIGNSVVEQTAELAFTELLKKHLK